MRSRRLLLALGAVLALSLAPATASAASQPGPPITVPTGLTVPTPAPSPTTAPTTAPGPQGAPDPSTGIGIPALEQWVEGSAPWLGNQLQLSLGNANGGDWFTPAYEIFAGIAIALLPLFYLLALLVSAIRRDAMVAIKTVILWTPAACIGTAIVIWGMKEALGITDSLCAYVLSKLGDNLTGLITHMTAALAAAAGAGVAGSLATGGGAAVVVFTAAIAFLLAAMAILLELAMRLAGIYIAAAFLPLTMVASIWPGARHLLRIHLETLVGLVLVKFFVVGILVIGAFAFTASPLSVSPGGEPGMADILMGAMILVLAALAPFSLLKILPWTAGQMTAEMGQRTKNSAQSHVQRADNVRQMVVDRMAARREQKAVAQGAASSGAVAGASKANIVLEGARVVISRATGVTTGTAPTSAGNSNGQSNTRRTPAKPTRRLGNRRG